MTDFKNKKIAILGYGIEGKDVLDFALSKKAAVTVFDRNEKVIPTGLPAESANVSFSLGSDYLGAGLTGFDYIFRSPGVKRSLPEILAAEQKGVVVSSATKLFFDLCPAKIIGVTGTKGKGTTATMIFEILKEAGKKVYLAGNIGQPMLSLLPKLKKDSYVVLELSSFQLQDLENSPHIAVVLFITSEHLDYHANAEEYVLAKSQIVRHQTKDDFAVLNIDNPVSASFASLTRAQVFNFSRTRRANGCFVENREIILNGEKIGRVDDLQLRGEHNWDNVCAAATAGYLVTESAEAVKKVIFSFRGLEHRLEFVAEISGIKFYNDSFSTTPETTIAAIKSFKEPIALIAGGSEKGSDFADLGKEIANSGVKALILIGAMAERIRQACFNAGYSGKIVFRPGGMAEAVGAAIESAGRGWVVLLSPACASFDMFANYKDRGEQFKINVKKRKGER